MRQTNFICKTEIRLLEKENELRIAGGGERGGWIVRELGKDTCTLLCLKRITRRTYCTAQGTLLDVMRQPGWAGVWGRMDTCTRMAESLCCPPETTTTLLISYTPIQNKSL